MSILHWGSVPKAESHEDWSKRSAEGAPPGVYTPNMSEADRHRWKAKKIGGKTPRIEIRKSVVGFEIVKPGKYESIPYSQMLVIVTPKSVTISGNGPMQFSDQEYRELTQAVNEAKEAL